MLSTSYSAASRDPRQTILCVFGALLVANLVEGLHDEFNGSVEACCDLGKYGTNMFRLKSLAQLVRRGLCKGRE